MTYVKICGITNLDDARCAAEAGADFLGFIFYPKSPRFVEPEQAAKIAKALKAELGGNGPRWVGVFVDEPVARVQALLDLVGLDLAQLHGNESRDMVRSLVPCAFKAIRPRTYDEAEAAVIAYRDVLSSPKDAALPQLLIDAYHSQQFGGTGISADLVVARSVARQVRLLLAGGLTPETVTTAIEQVRPWGVDVSSGVEAAKGIKDHARVRAFIRAARQWDASAIS